MLSIYRSHFRILLVANGQYSWPITFKIANLIPKWPLRFNHQFSKVKQKVFRQEGWIGRVEESLFHFSPCLSTPTDSLKCCIFALWPKPLETLLLDMKRGPMNFHPLQLLSFRRWISQIYQISKFYWYPRKTGIWDFFLTRKFCKTIFFLFVWVHSSILVSRNSSNHESFRIFPGLVIFFYGLKNICGKQGN